ncbi:MAG TPA: hypothetical protein VMK65_01140 [Longimicrobiales bacterium]|nr:hypothetical protein [Longimicrobiales bacterium]
MKTTTRAAALAATVMMMAPLAATASTGDDSMTTRAQELKAQAEQLYDQPGQWKAAAGLLVRSAALLDRTDAQRYETLLTAGRVYGQAGDLNKARQALEEAAQCALERGAVFHAGQAYLEAAHVAARQGSARRATELREKARALAESPHLSVESRRHLLEWSAE